LNVHRISCRLRRFVPGQDPSPSPQSVPRRPPQSTAGEPEGVHHWPRAAGSMQLPSEPASPTSVRP